MAKKLKYFGQAYASEVYVGKKAVTLNFAKDQGFNLAEKVLRASNAGKGLSLTAYFGKRRQKTQVTVTWR